MLQFGKRMELSVISAYVDLPRFVIFYNYLRSVMSIRRVHYLLIMPSIIAFATFFM